MQLSDKYPFLTNYFTTMLNAENHKIPQSILFWGSDFDSQFTISQEIARLLNCTGDKSDTCNCLNCNWIRDNSHPAVQIISRIDNKPSDDDSKTVISIKQATEIKSSLMVSSDFHRVFIFCDRDEHGNFCGLNHHNFQEETANSLLKIIEEPTTRVTFIFLTRYKEDLLQTIISRSQCFYVPSFNRPNTDFSLIEGVFTNYYDFKRKDVFDIATKLGELTKENDSLDILNSIQNYILSLIKSNPYNNKFICDIKKVEEAKRQIALNMNSQNIFENLCLELIH